MMANPSRPRVGIATRPTAQPEHGAATGRHHRHREFGRAERWPDYLPFLLWRGWTCLMILSSDFLASAIESF